MNATLSKKVVVTGAAALMLAGSTATAAFAVTGSVAQARQVVFYYGETSGNGDSQDFSGYGTAKLCADAPGATSNNSFNVKYYLNRSLQRDDILKDTDRLYSQGQYLSAGFSTTSSSRYHTYVGWSAVPAASNGANGFSRAVGSSC